MKISNLLFILISSFLSFTANAKIVAIDFTATATNVDFLTVSPPGVFVGSSLNGKFTFDTSSNPKGKNGDLQFQIGTFNPSSSSSADISNANSTFADIFTIVSGLGSTETYFDQDHFSFFDGNSVFTPTGTVRVQLRSFTINLSKPSGAIFDIDNLTGFPTSIDAFANATFNADFFISEPVGFFANISGTLDSVTVSNVPLPASFWLMGTAVMGILGFSRKRNKVTV